MSTNTSADVSGLQMAPLPVYVVHYRAPDWCRNTVASLKRSDVPTTVTVVNNGGSLNLAERVLELPENVGYTGAANVALRDAGNAPLVVIASHDVSVSEDCLRRLLDAAEAHPNAGILGAAVGAHGRVLASNGGVDVCEWTSGTCLMLRRDCVAVIGGFDERFHSYGEDVDVGVAARAAGWDVLRVRSARATQRGSSIGGSRATTLVAANQMLRAYKWDGARGFLGQVLHFIALTAGYGFAGLRPGAGGSRYRRNAVACGRALVLVVERFPLFRRR